jgi:amidase
VSELVFDTAVRLAARIKRRELSAQELLEHFIRRIERDDGALNAIVVRDFERARAHAHAADENQAAGEHLGPLHGVPVTVKESFDVAALATTWGDTALKSHIATRDDPTIARLRAAGAIVLGKTNVSTQLQDLQAANAVYGITRNPWDLARSPGGSSGGSAAALAAGFSSLELGTDLAGSVRNPAHSCGVYGHKPTFNIVPTHATTPPQVLSIADMAVAGPLARSAEDLALAMDLLAGPDEFQAGGWHLELRRRSKPLRQYRIAFWMHDSQAPVSREVANRCQQLADLLARLGVQVSDTARPECTSGQLNTLFRKLLAATINADHSLSHTAWLALEHERTKLRYLWKEFFQLWDILICPIAPTTAIAHDPSPLRGRKLRVDDTEVPFFQQLFWSGLATSCYLPSTAFPTGLSAEGLPIGLQAIGAEYHDYMTIDFAAQLAREIGGFVPPASG